VKRLLLCGVLECLPAGVVLGAASADLRLIEAIKAQEREAMRGLLSSASTSMPLRGWGHGAALGGPR
jgi:hypothetical protein